MIQNAWAREAAEIAGEDEPEQPRFNLIKPDSTCPSCGHLIRAWENVPVVSYLALGGKCSQCKARISPRYPIVELATGLLSLALAWQFGATVQTAALLVLGSHCLDDD